VGKSSFLKAGVLPLLELLHPESWSVLPTFRARQEIVLNLVKTIPFDMLMSDGLEKFKSGAFRLLQGNKHANSFMRFFIDKANFCRTSLS